MKKIILTLIFCLFLIGIVFANYFQYIGRNVMITCYSGHRYTGRVENVIEIQICKQKDAFDNCIYSDYYYTIYLRSNESGMITIPGESIEQIREIK